MKKILSPLPLLLYIFGVLLTHPVIAQTAKPKSNTPVTTASIPSVVIGPHTWTTKNLDVTTFANGDKIDQAQSEEEWIKAGNESKPAWCYYENDAEKGKTYGLLYNWFAVADPRGLAPKGWHVPSRPEWTALFDYLGGKNVAGNKLKSKTLWEAVSGIDRNGYDSLGFTALPAGLRFDSNAKFDAMGQRCQFWTSTQNNYLGAAIAFLGINNPANIGIANKKFGYSVRCMKD